MATKLSAKNRSSIEARLKSLEIRVTLIEGRNRRLGTEKPGAYDLSARPKVRIPQRKLGRPNSSNAYDLNRR